MHMTEPFINRVSIRNYKSIAACQVDLRPLMFLVGPNGGGKSSFLDAIKFVADSLTNSLDHALRERGTIAEVRRRSGGHPTHFIIRLDFNLPSGHCGHYSFTVGTSSTSDVEVRDEECSVWASDDLSDNHFYRITNQSLVNYSGAGPAPVFLPDRLALVSFAGTAAFRPVFDALSRIEIYNLNPKDLGAPQRIDPSDQLRRDGSNAASLLRSVSTGDMQRINQMLGKIVPGVKGVEAKSLGSYETMEFLQDVEGQKHPWRFLASSMSDGTLRSLGILLATMQSTKTGPLLIGLEEPETAVHPAAARTLMEALWSASEQRQVLVTSHSPDLLDDPDIAAESILSVHNEQGKTFIGPISSAGREVIRRRLFTPGELLRLNQLAPDGDAITPKQNDFFEGSEKAG